MTGPSDLKNLQWKNDEIASHLKSAVDTLTPDVLSRIDLSTPQNIYAGPSRVTRMYRRMRTVALAAAACLCVVLLGGGVAAYENHRVESIIGIDVNPSIELSVNRNEKVLKAEPLNGDAEEILDDMDLKDVDLDIAVNALIGSMVRHGYLNDLDNAILVTVSNENKEKASTLRQDVVVDIETSLEEHKVQAVVYDQEAVAKDEITALAEEYGISYGKAYFLQELVEENGLGEADLEAFAGMTMEEIAREIAERSYTVRRQDDSAGREESGAGESSADREESRESTVREESSGEALETEESESSSPETTSESGESGGHAAPSESGKPAETTAAPAETAGEEENEETSLGGRAKIDYVDYESGYLNVVFKEKVKWKNPAVSVQDENGQRYSAMITDTSSESCEIAVRGLPGGMDYTFTLAGVAPKEGGSYGSVRGYFDTPDIAPELTEPSDETEDFTEPETGEAETREDGDRESENAGEASQGSLDGQEDANGQEEERAQESGSEPRSSQASQENGGAEGGRNGGKHSEDLVVSSDKKELSEPSGTEGEEKTSQ